MPITNADVEKMLTIAAKAGKMDLDTLVKTIYQQDSGILPKMFQERARELIEGKPVAQPKEKSVWARKSTKQYAEDIGITAEDITNPTGQNGTIVLADVKSAFKAKRLAARVEPAKKEAKAVSSKKTPKPKPAPAPEPEKGPERSKAEEEDEGDEFEDEE